MNKAMKLKRRVSWQPFDDYSIHDKSNLKLHEGKTEREWQNEAKFRFQKQLREEEQHQKEHFQLMGKAGGQ